MRNSHNLTPKQHIFCEEYLIDGNSTRAYRVAYPNDKGNNAWRELKRKEVLEYINKRLEENQVTLKMLVAKAHKRLGDVIENGNDKEAVKASEVALEFSSRLKELEIPKSPNQPIHITIEQATK